MPTTTGPQAKRLREELVAAERSIFKDQLGLATRAQLLGKGLSRHQIQTAIRQGRWARVTRGVYALANWPDVANRRLLAVCLATGGVASHASAAWVWGLLEREPTEFAVTVPHGHTPGLTPSAQDEGNALFPGLSAIIVHQSRALLDEHISIWHAVPTTKPLRTIVDLAGVTGPAVLDGAIDIALSRRLVTVEALAAEASRLKQPGRRGPEQLVVGLRRRGFVGAPSPSVLESRALRLLHGAGIRVKTCEAAVDGGRYRIDIEVEGGVFLEVDGFAYHSSPEQKRYDETRRNNLRLLGYEILVYDWAGVTKDGPRLVSEVNVAVQSQKEKMAALGFSGQASGHVPLLTSPAGPEAHARVASRTAPG